MEVGIRVEAENIRSGTRRHTNSCYFTMVAVDDAGRPADVPQLRARDPGRSTAATLAAGIRRGLRREIADRPEARRREARGMSIWSWDGIVPVVDPTAFVHPDATVIGDVIVGLRRLRRPAGRCCAATSAASPSAPASNVQETCVVHSFPNLSWSRVGPSGHIGHGAVLHGCRIGRNAMVGMNAVVMDEAEVGEDSIVGAMAFVARAKIPPRSLAVGSPARVDRALSDADRLEDPRHRRLPAPGPRGAGQARPRQPAPRPRARPPPRPRPRLRPPRRRAAEAR